VREGRLIGIFSRDDGFRIRGAGYCVVAGRGRRHLRHVGRFVDWLRFELNIPPPETAKASSTATDSSPEG